MEASECDDLFPSSDLPWLMQLHGKTHKQEFMDPYSHCTLERMIPQLNGKLCLGFFGNWLLLADELTKKTFFLHRTLVRKLKVRLPSLHGESFEHLGSCVVSTTPTSDKRVVIFVGRGRDVILCCKPKIDGSWTNVQLEIDPQGDDSFTGQVVRFKGKIYVLHGHVLAHRVVVINEDLLLHGGRSWKIIQLPDRTIGWYNMVVMGNNLFFVSVDTSTIRRGTPSTFTIHRLRTSNRTWKSIESIGGCAFFLGGIQSSALPAAQAGAHRDCIYVMNQNCGLLHGEGVYKICIQDQSVSLSLLLKRPTNWICKLCWLMPTTVNQSRKTKYKTLRITHWISKDKVSFHHPALVN